MGKKAEVGTPKWLANKMKSKGLQKLRWYCQMCQKQCRDQNGFKCHITSESHQRQLLIFADNPGRFLNDFSKEFEDGYMSLLKRMHGTKRVEANKIYQEYIHEKDHVHMNATRWESLTGFVYYLGRTGKCVVDETEKGWYITWIDREPETIARQEALAKKDKLDKDDNERMAEFIERQVAMAKEKVEKEDEELGERYTELRRDNEEEKLSLKVFAKPKEPLPAVAKNVKAFKEKAAATSSSSSEKKRRKRTDDRTRKKSALEEIIEEDVRRRKRRLEIEENSRSSSSRRTEENKRGGGDTKDYWLREGIVVKVVTKSLGDKYYKQKGYVREVVDRYAAVVIMIGGAKAKVKLDQDHVETVIPSEGKQVVIVNGEHRGAEATLVDIDIAKYCARLKLSDGSVVSLPYEHFSKLYVELL